MSKKKNIDLLFKERLANHQVTPPPHIWNNIQAQLHKKEDTKVIPLWWKVAGVAALLALIFTVGNTLFNDTKENTFVEEHIQQDTIKNDNAHDLYIKEPSKQQPDNNTQPIVVDKKDPDNATNNATKLQELKANGIVTKNASGSTKSNSQTTPLVSSNRINNKEQEITTSKVTVQPHRNNTNLQNTNSSIAQQVNSTQNNTSNGTLKQNTPIASQKLAQKESPNNTQAIAGDKALKNTSTTIAQENKIDEAKKLEAPNTKTPSILDAIEEQEAIAEINKPTQKPENRWEIMPNVAPVFYNSITEGSSIDASFADNMQSSDTNISYGVAVSYAINNRLQIRSGVSNVNLSYTTGGLELGDGPVDAGLQSITYNNATRVTIPQDQGTFNQQGGAGGPFGEITPKAQGEEAFLNQSISYYEIPVELEYSLLNSKFGIQVIGGLSTLFLGDNEISVTAGAFNETLGEANNLSAVSFSTNVGLGFDYKLSKKLKFNLEPMFKYQLNPYTDSNVSFQPYYIGVYTGLSFKF